MLAPSFRARPELLVLAGALFFGACGAEPGRAAQPDHAIAQSRPTPPSSNDESPVLEEPVASNDALPEPPRGPASLDIHVPRGSRQPLLMTGSVETIRVLEPPEELAGWTEVALRGAAPEPQRFYLMTRPEGVKLPFSTGDRLSVEIDCRKGGWHRVCDGRVRDASRRPILIVAGSGDERIAEGWKIERGPLATSEHQTRDQKSIRHTHGLVIAREGRSAEILPHAWQRFQVRGERWLVQGYEVVWEGVRPPDAVDHRAFSLLRER